MGLWDRARQIFRSRRGREEEQWRERMGASVRDQQATLAQLRRALADLSTNRRRVELQLGRLRQQSAGLDAQAAEQVAAGHDDAARSALQRKIAIDKAVADLAGRHASLVSDEQRLTATADSVQTQIETFRIRKDTLIARESAATASAKVYQAQRDTGAIAGELDEVERRTRQLEVTAAAYDELADPTTDPEAWDAAFHRIEPRGGADGPQSLPQ